MKEEVGYSRYIKSLAMDLVVVLVACRMFCIKWFR